MEARLIFCGCGLIFFPSLGRTNSNTKHFLSYFWNTLKGTGQAPAAEYVRLKNLKGIKTAFKPLKGTTGIPVPLIWEFPCSGV